MFLLQATTQLEKAKKPKAEKFDLKRDGQLFLETMNKIHLGSQLANIFKIIKTDPNFWKSIAKNGKYLFVVSIFMAIDKMFLDNLQEQIPGFSYRILNNGLEISLDASENTKKEIKKNAKSAFTPTPLRQKPVAREGSEFYNPYKLITLPKGNIENPYRNPTLGLKDIGKIAKEGGIEWYVSPSPLEYVRITPSSGEITRTSQSIAQYSLEQERELIQFMTDYIFGPSEIRTLPSTTLGSHIRQEYGKINSQLNSLAQDLYGLSGSGFLFGRRLSHAKVGFDSSGQPFISIEDPFTYNYLKSLPVYEEKGPSIPSYVHASVPEGATVILDCKLKNGKWIQTNLLNEKNAEELLGHVYRRGRHHFAYLVSQTRFFEKKEDKLVKYLLNSAGGFKSHEHALDHRSIFFPNIITGAELLAEGTGRMNNTWIETVPFFSFSSHTTKLHSFVFGKKGNEYYVVDTDLSVRGKGKTKKEAIRDMATSGYCHSGVYYYYFEKEVGKTPKKKPTEIVAIPGEKSWVYSFLEKTQYLEGAYAITIFTKDPYTLGTGIVGTLSRVSKESVDREARAFHKGEAFRWESGDGYLLAADAVFISGAAFGLGGIKTASTIYRTASRVSLVAIGGLIGKGIYDNVRHLADEEEAYQKGVGMPLSRGAEIPK
ncbi:MAG: hypothetical protein ABIH83_05480, partial [Candidatus Micrarchaeota archaeon]